MYVRNDGVGPGDGHQPPPRPASNTCARSWFALAFASHCSAEGAGGGAATLAGAGGAGATAEAAVPASLSALERVLSTGTTVSSSSYLEQAWAASAARFVNAGGGPAPRAGSGIRVGPGCSSGAGLVAGPCRTEAADGRDVSPHQS